MYHAARKLHLWVGLVLAVVLLVEAVTGLILAEPWLVGQEAPQMPPGSAQPSGLRDGQGQAPPREGAKPATGGAFGMAKGLHQGKVGSLDLSWVIDLSAIGLVILVVSGVYLAIPILRAQSGRR